MTESITKKYSNDEIVVIWQPEKCLHAGLCASQLATVFDPAKRPWINLQGASPERIVEQVKRCPSGALSYTQNQTATTTHTSAANPTAPATQTTEEPAVEIQVMPDGPLVVRGVVKVKGLDGSETIKPKLTVLCRCGASANKPYCDGSHRTVNFKDS